MFKCPICSYYCENRSWIEEHHIVPRSMGGSDKRGNLLYLCPNCHKKIYVDGCISGSHSINCEDSIIIIGKFLSTDGYVLMYKIGVNGEEIVSKVDDWSINES